MMKVDKVVFDARSRITARKWKIIRTLLESQKRRSYVLIKG